MENREYINKGRDEEFLLRFSIPSSFVVVVLFLSVAGSVGVVQGYQNYTVGDSLGWFDKLEKPAVDYQKWATANNFTLGDFLIFNTDNNHSVVQTYNFTTYKLCDFDNASENDTTEWSAADPSATAPYAVTVPVPLMKEGMNYFFSGHYDGEQCENGQHFKINVTHGQGLPKSLRGDSSDESPAPISPESGDDNESAPDTIIPSSFDNPRDEKADDDKEPSGSVSLSFHMKILNMLFLLLICIFCMF